MYGGQSFAFIVTLEAARHPLSSDMVHAYGRGLVGLR